MTYEKAVTYILDIPKFTKKMILHTQKCFSAFWGILRRRLK